METWSLIFRGRNTLLYEKLIQILEGFTMKKFLLVIFIGMVLTMNLYGIVKGFMNDEIKDIDHIKETTTTVYME